MYKVDIEQGKEEWRKLRQGNVTGTTLKQALGTPAVQKTLSYQVVGERMTPPKFLGMGSLAMTRGIELEPVARKSVIEELGIDFVETGLLKNKDIPGFSISPDGIFEESGIIKGGLEIKCPSETIHVRYLIENNIPKDYYFQVVAPFIMSDDIEFWYFASFDDRNTQRPLFLKKIVREDIADKIPVWRDKLSNFLEEVDKAHTSLVF